MKNIITIFCAIFLIQVSFAQRMIIHSKSAGNVEMELGKIDSITFTTSFNPGGLMANPGYLNIEIGKSMFSHISGGVTPYKIENFPNSMVATATLTGDNVTVNAVAIGYTSVGISDNSIPPKYIEIFISVMGGPGGLFANPSYVEVQPGVSKTSEIGGGTAPYSIHLPPDPTIATATVSGTTVTINGVSGGRTFFVVKDNSNPFKTTTIEVRVWIPFTTPGIMSFDNTVKNFSANGIFLNTDSLPTNSQGVGGFYMINPISSSHQADLIVIGYFKNSDTSWDVAMIEIQDTLSVKTGTYNFGDDPGFMKRAMCRYGVAWNPNLQSDDDPFTVGYRLTSGSVNLSAFTTDNAQGTFSGSGLFVNNAIPDPTKPITVTNGSFNAPVVKGEPKSASDRKAINKLLQIVTQKYSRQ